MHTCGNIFTDNNMYSSFQIDPRNSKLTVLQHWETISEYAWHLQRVKHFENPANPWLDFETSRYLSKPSFHVCSQPGATSTSNYKGSSEGTMKKLLIDFGLHFHYSPLL